jgi:hypothetical protein
MTLVFITGCGGLFHPAALVWWAALGVVGGRVVEWVARRRRHWNAGVAKAIFSTALVMLALYLSLSLACGVAYRLSGATIYCQNSFPPALAS